ncbi:Sulfate/thiosulfate import ATP-binding protein CysA [Planktothrix agardhii]|nr:Sulfate/thiosulfate import ATP-binding protein CysA [Planktothrix agardhii]
MTQSVILHLEDVGKQFPQNQTPAVQAVNLDLHEGDILGLLGPSGCGKTTLLRMIAGFEQPDTGNHYPSGAGSRRFGLLDTARTKRCGNGVSGLCLISPFNRC